EEKDLEQARLGIDAVRALLPLMPEEEVAPVKEALSQLQMAYAQAAGGEAKPQTPHPTPQTKKRAPRPAKRSGLHPARERHHRRVRRLGLLPLPRRRRGGGGGDAVRPAVGADQDRRGGGHAGGVHATARRPARAARA